MLFKLSAEDAKQINRRRTTSAEIAERIAKNRIDVTFWPLGAQAHIGNEVAEGEAFPMIVTAVNSDICVNGQVFLDGNDCYWATSALEGIDGHQWSWPKIS